MGHTTPQALRRQLVGFDLAISDILTKSTNQNYPPHNIIRLDDDTLKMEMAVAGFSKKDIDIVQEGDTLKITGNKESSDHEYVHKGIANRSFRQSFKMSPHLKVKSVEMKLGILSIEMKQELPEELKPVKFDIK